MIFPYGSMFLPSFSHVLPIKKSRWHSPRNPPPSVKDHHRQHGFKDGRLHDAPGDDDMKETIVFFSDRYTYGPKYQL